MSLGLGMENRGPLERLYLRVREEPSAGRNSGGFARQTPRRQLSAFFATNALQSLANAMLYPSDSDSVLPPIPEYRNWKMAKTAARAYSKLTCFEAAAPGDDGQEAAPRSPSTDSHSDSDADAGTSLARGRTRDTASNAPTSALDGGAWRGHSLPDAPPNAWPAAPEPANPAGRDQRSRKKPNYFKAGAAPAPRDLHRAERAKSPTN